MGISVGAALKKIAVALVSDKKTLKKAAMAFSPEWPKGGLPRSCARQAAATMSPMW